LFDRMRHDIEGDDIAISLLEHSYMGDPVPCTQCPFFLGDEDLIPQIKNVGFDVLSLAGNHIGDVAGLKAEIRTLELLKANNLTYMGAGANIEEASKPAIIEKNGIKYAFLGADDIAWYYWASANGRGSNTYSTADAKHNKTINYAKIQKDVAYAKSQADVVIAYMSWGREYINYAEKQEIDMGHALIDAGVDLIIGTHPHWVKDMEVYKGKLIIYSLGNFIFDHTHTDPTRESIYVNLNFYKGNLINVDIVPILNCGYHFGAKNIANDYLNGKITYADVDKTDERKACIWLQPKPIPQEHPIYRVIMDRLMEHTNI
jgi:poly-gamma-glutamate capsule biosynthesis protein CapA/YwtB (metallophosphatase superfamily)